MQDLPPQSGFESLPYKRNIPSRGPPGAVLLTAVGGIVAVGFFLYKRGRLIAE